MNQPKKNPDQLAESSSSLLGSIIEAQPEVKVTLQVEAVAVPTNMMIKQLTDASRAQQPPGWKNGIPLGVTDVRLRFHISERTMNRSVCIEYMHGELIIAREWLSPKAPSVVLQERFTNYGAPLSSLSVFLQLLSFLTIPVKQVTAEAQKAESTLMQGLKLLFDQVKTVTVTQENGFDRVTVVKTMPKPERGARRCICGSFSCPIGPFTQEAY